MYRIDPSQVRDAASGDLLSSLVGQPVQVVIRDTTTPYPIYTAVGDPIAESLVTVTRAIETPTVWIDTDDPGGVFIDWYDPSAGVRGPIPFEAVSRAAAVAAGQSAAAAATSAETAAAQAAELATGVVRRINGLVPDEDGELDLGPIGGGGGFLVLNNEADLPDGTPALTPILRFAGGPVPPVTPDGIAVVAGSLATARGSGETLTLTTPAGVSAGDLLVAVAAHQNGTPAGWTLPAGWRVLHWISSANYPDARLLAILGYPVVDPANVPATHAFTTPGGGGRILGGLVRVTAANLGTPVAGVSQAGAIGGSTQYTIPKVTAPAGSLGVLVYMTQATAGVIWDPTTLDLPGWDRLLDLASVDDTTVTRTVISVYTKVLDEDDIPAATITWAGQVGARFGLGLAIAAAP